MNSKENREKIGSIKSELSQTKSYYSDKINQLREEESQLQNNLADKKLLTEKLIEKQEQKRQTLKNEIKQLEKERDEKIDKLGAELAAIKSNHNGASMDSKNKKENRNGIIADIKLFIKRHRVLSIIVLSIAIFTIVLNVNNARNNIILEEYDVKGLSVKEACEKVKNAGWNVDEVVSRERDDKTDCYNTNITVTDYYYHKYNHSVTIYFGEKKTEEEKKTECEATGKWYRDGQCKSQEEWENDYAWKNAHAACKKYGSSGYAKTLTDCYIGDEYVGSVDGQPANSQQNTDGQAINDDVKEETATEEEKSEVQNAESNTQSGTNNATNYDDPDHIPQNEVSTGIAACQRVAKNKYGLKIKTTEFVNGYTGNENYSWMYVFRGSSYDMLTCQYNWKTGYAEIMYVSL